MRAISNRPYMSHRYVILVGAVINRPQRKTIVCLQPENVKKIAVIFEGGRLFFFDYHCYNFACLNHPVASRHPSKVGELMFEKSRIPLPWRGARKGGVVLDVVVIPLSGEIVETG